MERMNILPKYRETSLSGETYGCRQPRGPMVAILSGVIPRTSRQPTRPKAGLQIFWRGGALIVGGMIAEQLHGEQGSALEG
jgi:hypothetical protein